MGKKSRERRERQQQRMAEVQRARVAQSGTLYDKILASDKTTSDTRKSMLESQVIHGVVEFEAIIDEFDYTLPFPHLWIEIEVSANEHYGLLLMQDKAESHSLFAMLMCDDDYYPMAVAGWPVIKNVGYADLPLPIYLSTDIDLNYIVAVPREALMEGKMPYPPRKAHDDDYANSILGIGLTVLSIMNCRNIELVDHAPDPAASREYERHFGRPLTTYKTLRIKPTGKRYEQGSEPKPYQGIMPLHIRRGNFATYSDDAPLFGKYTGTFWRPATAVGERENGIVVKDYEVEAQETA